MVSLYCNKSIMHKNVEDLSINLRIHMHSSVQYLHTSAQDESTFPETWLLAACEFTSSPPQLQFLQRLEVTPSLRASAIMKHKDWIRLHCTHDLIRLISKASDQKNYFPLLREFTILSKMQLGPLQGVLTMMGYGLDCGKTISSKKAALKRLTK